MLSQMAILNAPGISIQQTLDAHSPFPLLSHSTPIKGQRKTRLTSTSAYGWSGATLPPSGIVYRKIAHTLKTFSSPCLADTIASSPCQPFYVCDLNVCQRTSVDVMACDRLSFEPVVDLVM